MFFNQDGWFWDILVSDGSILQKKKKKKLKNFIDQPRISSLLKHTSSFRDKLVAL